jgi:uncharacterized protein (TIGR03067 family)
MLRLVSPSPLYLDRGTSPDHNHAEEQTMRQHLIGLALVTLALTTPACSDDKPSVEVKSSVKVKPSKEVWSSVEEKPSLDNKLFGTWVMIVVKGTGRDKRFNEGETRFVFEKDGNGRMGVKKDFPSPTEIDFTYKAAAVPGQDFRAMDLTVIDSNRLVVGEAKYIYRIEGDTLTLISGATPDRPKSFDQKDAAVMTLKRQKP